MSKQKTLSKLVCVFLGVAFAIAGCHKNPPAIVGQWRTEAPGSLLYDFLEDGNVVLIKESERYPVFHYKFLDKDSLQLFDGMGRMRQYDFHISGDTMTFYDSLDAHTVVAEYTREK